MPIVWPRFGKVVNYVEPMANSAAMLLGCPTSQRPRVETINDVNGFVSNFWRATRTDPEAVAAAADYPVIETDLHARHRWLLAQAAGLREKLDADPDYFDARIAGWWVWGASAWIGSGWCEEGRNPPRQPPELGNGGSADSPQPKAGKGIHAAGMREPSRQLPALGGGGASNAGLNGVGMREPSRQLPDLGGGHDTFGRGVHAPTQRTALFDIFAALSERLRYVRVACGDWSRICTPAVTYRHGLTAVFLDPPYDGFEHLYATRSPVEPDIVPLSTQVRAWALLNGERPDMRIALCGYEGEHVELKAAGWECVAWKAKGGYGNQREDGENENARRERIWFSPACLRPGRDVGQLDMLARMGV